MSAPQTSHWTLTGPAAARIVAACYALQDFDGAQLEAELDMRSAGSPRLEPVTLAVRDADGGYVDMPPGVLARVLKPMCTSLGEQMFGQPSDAERAHDPWSDHALARVLLDAVDGTLTVRTYLSPPNSCATVYRTGAIDVALQPDPEATPSVALASVAQQAVNSLSEHNVRHVTASLRYAGGDRRQVDFVHVLLLPGRPVDMSDELLARCATALAEGLRDALFDASRTAEDMHGGAHHFDMRADLSNGTCSCTLSSYGFSNTSPAPRIPGAVWVAGPQPQVLPCPIEESARTPIATATETGPEAP